MGKVGFGPGRGERIWADCWQFCLSPGFCPRIAAQSSQEPALPRVKKKKSAGAGDSKINQLQSCGCRQTQGKDNIRFRPRPL